MPAADTNATIKTVTYEAGGRTMKSRLATSAGAGERPGVLVLPEWWGLNDYIERRAREVAALGYTALAVDMYGDGKTADNPNDAGNLMNGVLNDMATGQARLEAALATLCAQPGVDASRIGAIGYCFGGAMVLHMARVGLPLAAVVSFHGALGSFHAPAPGEVKAKVLVCHGAADQFISAEEMANFRKEMDAAKADCRIIEYAGALHGFTNPDADANGKKYGIPLAYDADADRRSWDEMAALFREVLG